VTAHEQDDRGRRGRCRQPPGSPAPHRRPEHVSLPARKAGSLAPTPHGLRRLRPPSEELPACRRKRQLLRGRAWPLLAMKTRVLAEGCAARPSAIPPGNQLLRVGVKSQGVPACSCQRQQGPRAAFCPIPAAQGVSRAPAPTDSDLHGC